MRGVREGRYEGGSVGGGFREVKVGVRCDVEGSLGVRWFEGLCFGKIGRGEWEWGEKGKRRGWWSGVVW